MGYPDYNKPIPSLPPLVQHPWMAQGGPKVRPDSMGNPPPPPMRLPQYPIPPLKMQKCPYCGRAKDLTRATCPGCGAPER